MVTLNYKIQSLCYVASIDLHTYLNANLQEMVTNNIDTSHTFVSQDYMYKSGTKKLVILWIQSTLSKTDTFWDLH